MFARFGCLSVLPWILFAQMSWNMTVPVVTAAPRTYEVPPEVDDRSGLFSQSVKREARRALRQIRYEHRVLISVETVKLLGRESFAEMARQRARPLGAQGIYVLAAKLDQEKDVAVVLGSDKAHGLLVDADRDSIRDAFLGPIRAGRADEGLEKGILRIRTTLAEAAATRPKPNSWDVVLPLTIMFALLVVLMGIQVGQGDSPRKSRKRTVESPIFSTSA